VDVSEIDGEQAVFCLPYNLSTSSDMPALKAPRAQLQLHLTL